VLNPKYARRHNLCPICIRSGCTALHAQHSEREIEQRIERERDEARENEKREQKETLASE
jgi:hypothetical protein